MNPHAHRESSKTNRLTVYRVYRRYGDAEFGISKAFHFLGKEKDFNDTEFSITGTCGLESKFRRIGYQKCLCNTVILVWRKRTPYLAAILLCNKRTWYFQNEI